MLLSKAKDDFMEYLEIEQNRSRKTIGNYDHYLTRLIDYAGDIKVSDINPELVRKWRLWLNRLGTNTSDELSQTTLNYHLIALRSFLKFCAKREIKTMPADKIELARTKRKQVTFLTPEEIERLFAQPNQETTSGLRDRAILELLFSSGLRVSELVGLDREHINLKRKEFMVRGKGQKDRPVFISQQAADWVQVRADYPDDEFFVIGDFNQELVHPRYYGSRANRSALQSALSEACLVALTADENDPIRRDSAPCACIDHICARRDSLWTAEQTVRWPNSPVPIRSLTDHFGLSVTLTRRDER